MKQGYGIIINLDNKLPFTFHFNPDNVQDDKKINYAIIPNIGGRSKERVFTGFDSGEFSFSIVLIDKTDPLGVNPSLDWFKTLREPAPGLLGIAGSFFGNENYPPPKVLYCWGTGSLVPLVWDVIDLSIIPTHFKNQDFNGVMGIPWRAEVTISLALDENNVMNKVNQIAKKANAIAGSVTSIGKEANYQMSGGRRDMNPLYKGDELNVLRG